MSRDNDTGKMQQLMKMFAVSRAPSQTEELFINLVCTLTSATRPFFYSVICLLPTDYQGVVSLTLFSVCVRSWRVSRIVSSEPVRLQD